MDRKLVGAMLLLLASTGCRMCSNCGDSLPPVLDGPYPNTGGRAGSAFGNFVDTQPLPQSLEEITDPTPAEEESTEELSEDLTAALDGQDLLAHPPALAFSPEWNFVRADD